MTQFVGCLLAWWLVLGSAIAQQAPLQGRVGEVVSLTPQTMAITQQTIRLGDNSYDDWSSGSEHLKEQHSPQPKREFPFYCSPAHCTGQQPLTLMLGNITGLDTLAEHTATQSPNPYHASPVKLWLNNQPIGKIYRNGVDHQIPLGPMPSGRHTLRIQTGWHIDSTGRQDWDDMAIAGVWLRVDD